MFKSEVKAARLAGRGVLSYPGFTSEVDYEIQGAAVARRGAPPVRGRLTTTPEAARALFRAVHANLRLEGGEACRIVLLGHSEGSGTAYFEASR